MRSSLRKKGALGAPRRGWRHCKSGFGSRERSHDGRGLACARSDESGADPGRGDRPFEKATWQRHETVKTTEQESGCVAKKTTQAAKPTNFLYRWLSSSIRGFPG